MKLILSGIPAPLFIAGIKYPSIFSAVTENTEGDKRAFSHTSLSLALKKSGGEPCKVKRNVVVLESWVKNRMERIAVWQKK
jgi:hypothetical protein